MTVAAGKAYPTAPSGPAPNEPALIEFAAAIAELRQCPAPGGPARKERVWIESAPAMAELRQCAAREPRRAQIWRQLADHLDAAGDRDGAASAYLEHVRQAPHDPLLMRAASAVHANRIPEAETLLRE